MSLMEELLDMGKSLLESVWEWCRKIFVKIVNFATNIVAFFKDPGRLKQLEKQKELLAISIKDKLANGDYHTVNCLFNKTTGDVEISEEDTLGIESEGLDAKTQKHFGDKDMIILK